MIVFATIIATLSCLALGFALWRLVVITSKLERRDSEAANYARLARSRHAEIVDLREALKPFASKTNYFAAKSDDIRRAGALITDPPEPGIDCCQDCAENKGCDCQTIPPGANQETSHE